MASWQGSGTQTARQLPGAMQFGEHESVATVGFDAITWPPGDACRGDNDAVVSGIDDLPVKAIAAGAGLVAALEFDIGLGEFFEQSGDGFRRVVDGAVASDLTIALGIGEGNGNGFFVDIHAHVEGNRHRFSPKQS